MSLAVNQTSASSLGGIVLDCTLAAIAEHRIGIEEIYRSVGLAVGVQSHRVERSGVHTLDFGMLLDLLLHGEVDIVVQEQVLQTIAVPGVDLLHAVTVTSLYGGFYHEFVTAGCNDFHCLVECDFFPGMIEMPVHVLDNTLGLPYIREQLGIDVLVEISIDEVVAVQCRNDKEVIDIH